MLHVQVADLVTSGGRKGAYVDSMRKLATLLVLLPLFPLLPLTGGCDPATDAVPTPTQCTAPTGAGTKHAANITADETWTAAASPHVIPYDMSIRATVTLEPCATVQIAKQITVSLDQPGSVLVAKGEAGRPVTITALDPKTPWAKLRLFNGGTTSLTYTNVDGGGDRLNTVDYLAAAIEARADQTKAAAPVLDVHHVKISGALANGVIITEGAGFSDTSEDLVITGSGVHPIHSWGRSAGTIPAGTYTGNVQDTILLSAGPSGQGDIKEDTTFHDRGIPYELGTANGALESRLDVDDPSIPLLTIEPGVTIRFQKDRGKLLIGTAGGDGAAQGAISAIGTASKPIVFTSAEPNPAKGDWNGIWFGRTPDPRDRMDYVTVEWAGSDQGKATGSNSCTKESWAAVRFMGYGAPTESLMTNVKILHSGKNAIDRGWRADSVADLSGNGNFFDDLSGCVQTTPKDHNGACPNPIPCP
ncbi:hypothetical protein BH09MYX1_BH09MYX1_62770 [soil metagenome]